MTLCVACGRDACAIFFPSLLTDVPPVPRGQRIGVPFPVVHQVDMAPSLALMLDIGVPAQSIGAALPAGWPETPEDGILGVWLTRVRARCAGSPAPALAAIGPGQQRAAAV